MLCSNCKRHQASVFWEQTSDGDTRKIALCHECAAVAGPPASVTPDFDESVFANMFGLAYVEPKSTEVCPLCNITLREIVKNGSVGCPKCYEKYAPELEGALNAIHKNSFHTGSMPKKYAEKKERESRLTLLKAELKYSVEKENFERCGILRDEIRELEKSAKTDEKKGAGANGMV